MGVLNPLNLTLCIPVIALLFQQPSQPLELTDIVAATKPGVVAVIVYNESGELLRQGSGFFVSNETVVTSLHVLRDAKKGLIRMANGSEFSIQGVVADDEHADLAMLSINGVPKDVKPLHVADRVVREGERVIVIGSPMGLESSVSDGVIAALRKLPEFGDIIQITAAVSPGSSGSPVLDSQGQVIGVVRSQIRDGQALNFAAPASEVLKLRVGAVRSLPLLAASPDVPKLSDSEREAWNAWMAKDFRTAAGWFRKVVENDPTNALNSHMLGECLEESQQWKEAVDAYRHAIDVDPKGAWNHSGLGKAYMGMRRFEDGAASLKEALRIQPGNADASLYLGLAYAELGETENAIAAYKESIRGDPNSHKGHFLLGLAYVAQKRWQDAVNAYRLADRCEPNNCEILYRLSVACLGTKDWDCAIEASKAAIAIKPDHAAAHWVLGLAYVNRGDRGAALDEYKKLKELDPDAADSLFSVIYP
jgi:tetratricopeptide (TPR) repeat protein